MKLYKKILIHGNFEVMHTGHVRLFAYAKELGNELIVGLYVKDLESSEIIRREEALLSSSLVDGVVRYSELEELISEVKPQVIVKGREFINLDNPEETLVAEFGGQVIFHSGQEYINRKGSSTQVFDSTHLMRNYLSGFVDRNNVGREDLERELDGVSALKVLVVGDVIVDEYIECQPIGLSQETASVVARPTSSRVYLGGAGIVAAHCAGFGCKTDLLTILGNDNESKFAEELLQGYNVTTRVVRDSTHPTILKQRYRADKQVLFRLNRFREEGFTRSIRASFNQAYSDLIPNYDCVIFSDFSYGVFDDRDSLDLVHLAKKAGLFVSADSQSSSQTGYLGKFVGVDLVTPTEREARLETKSKEGLIALSQDLLKTLNSRYVFLTLGGDGLLITGKNFRTDYIPALNENPIDLAGAGDSLLSISTLMLAQGSDAYQSGLMGSIAAAMQVSTLGNTPLSVSKLKQLISEIYP
jgi:rfaE bifunctional protein kinase chain/domain